MPVRSSPSRPDPALPRAQDFSSDLAVVKRLDPAFRDLIGFVPLAGDHDDIAGAGQSNPTLDRGPAVGNALEVCGPVNPRLDLPDNRLGIFASGVVGREDRVVREV